MKQIGISNSSAQKFRLPMVPAALLVALMSFGGTSRAFADNLDNTTADDRLSEEHDKCESASEGSWLYTVKIPGTPATVFLDTETYDG